MSSPYKIEPSGRTTVCSPGCRHPTCEAIERAATKLQRDIELGQVTALVDRVHRGLIGSPTLAARVDATNALRELAELAKVPR